MLGKVRAHLDTIPADRRPILSAYGESLGGWGMQDAFLDGGAQAIRESGIRNMINVGTPRFSKLREQTVTLAGHRLDPTGTIFEFNDLQKLQGLDAPRATASADSC